MNFNLLHCYFCNVIKSNCTYKYKYLTVITIHINQYTHFVSKDFILPKNILAIRTDTIAAHLGVDTY